MARKKTTATPRAGRRSASKTYDKEIQQLLEVGRKEGKLEQHEIFEQIPDTPANIDVLEQLYAEMEEESIEFVPAEEPTKAEIKDEGEWIADTEAEESLPEDTAYMDDIADDSVRLYLREIGKIP